MKPVPINLLGSKSFQSYRNWIQTTNPLHNLTMLQAESLFRASRNGNTIRLQWLYQEIERTDPTLLVCVERRSAALLDLDWTIRKRSAEKTRNFDDTLATEQAGFLAYAFAEMEDRGLYEAIEHLSGAFFRGFAHVQPLWEGDTVAELQCLAPWNFVRDPDTGIWGWAPDCNAAEAQPVPPGALLSVVRNRHIDYPAVAIYLRNALGERKWGQFVERYGIPPVIITMPPDVDPTLREEYAIISNRGARKSIAGKLSGAVAFKKGETITIDEVPYVIETANTSRTPSFTRFTLVVYKPDAMDIDPVTHANEPEE